MGQWMFSPRGGLRAGESPDVGGRVGIDILCGRLLADHRGGQLVDLLLGVFEALTLPGRRVLEHVLAESQGSDEGLLAQHALVGPLACVGPAVVGQIDGLQEGAAAYVALEVPLVAMRLQVSLQFHVVDVALAALLTQVLPGRVVPLLVARQACA